MTAFDQTRRSIKNSPTMEMGELQQKLEKETLANEHLRAKVKGLKKALESAERQIDGNRKWIGLLLEDNRLLERGVQDAMDPESPVTLDDLFYSLSIFEDPRARKARKLHKKAKKEIFDVIKELRRVENEEEGEEGEEEEEGEELYVNLMQSQQLKDMHTELSDGNCKRAWTHGNTTIRELLQKGSSANVSLLGVTHIS
ncbi:hypothetical protein BKA81DRAFT_433932 [Phyllosticta paracitricarpa]